MNIADAVVLVVVLLFVGLAIRYIVKSKKKGGCVGCEAACSCSRSCGEKIEE